MLRTYAFTALLTVVKLLGFPWVASLPKCINMIFSTSYANPCANARATHSRSDSLRPYDFRGLHSLGFSDERICLTTFVVRAVNAYRSRKCLFPPDAVPRAIEARPSLDLAIDRTMSRARSCRVFAPRVVSRLEGKNRAAREIFFSRCSRRQSYSTPARSSHAAQRAHRPHGRSRNRGKFSEKRTEINEIYKIL
jgi:hypothetical protein